MRYRSCIALYFALLLICSLSLIHRLPLKHHGRFSYCFKKTLNRQTSTKVMAYAPWDDDLPNLFGINPIEAALIGAVLYYVYGPEELYSYAREAGKFVSTYFPIVKDLTLNIFNEFKDYIDEDRQRDDMKKRGIDLSNFPRRTTNILERIQQNLAMFSEMTTVTGGIDAEIQSGLQSDDFAEQLGETSLGSIRDLERVNGDIVKKKSKKSILKNRNIDVKNLIRRSEEQSAGDGDAIAQSELQKSLTLVQNQFQTLAAARQNEIDTSGLFGASSSGTSFQNKMKAPSTDDGDMFYRGEGGSSSLAMLPLLDQGIDHSTLPTTTTAPSHLALFPSLSTLSSCTFLITHRSSVSDW